MSDLQRKILDILKDSEFHSGESLGEKLGVSRTAIWKQLQKLESMGLQLESIKGTGYRLAAGFELLDRGVILSALKQRKSAIPRHLEIFQSIDSTNKYAKEQAEQREFSCSVVMAEQQSSGRGRRGKTWVSPFAANIYMSIVWDFQQGAQSLEGLSLGVGVAVRRALIEIGLTDVKLKWPNDIYVDQKKLGGILLEMIGDPAGDCSVVIGIGINVSMSDTAAGQIDQAWTDVQTQASAAVSRNQLGAAVIAHCFDLLGDFQRVGFQAYRDEWQSADAFAGMSAKVVTPKESIEGRILGVDTRGALEMELANGQVEQFIGGELSLRLAE